MAKSILDIVIKLRKEGGADKEVIKGLVGLKTSIMNAAAVGGTLVAAGFAIKQVFDQTVGTLINYANEVRRISDATGLSAEESSKLIQVLDDQKISFEELEKVVAKNGKTFDYSIEGLARMSDEYLGLTDANAQAAYMQERFGKQWISFVPVMKQGRDAILDSADAIDSNLILTEKSILATRRWEIQMDNLNDKVLAVKLSLGQGLLGILDGSTVAITKNAQAIFKAANGYEFNTNMAGRYTDAQRAAWEEAKKQAEQEWIKAEGLDASSDATQTATQTAEQYAEALKEISAAHQSMLGLIGQVASAEQSYQETAQQLTQERIQIEQERAAAVAAGWWEVSEKIREYDAALEENAVKVEENAAKHHEAMGKIQYDLFLTKLSVDGITDAEFAMAQQAGLMFGIFDEKSVQAAKSMDAVAAAVAAGKIKVDDMDRALRMMQKGYSIDVVIDTIVKMASQTYSESGKTEHIGQERRAMGTGGWREVPPGYPNDSYAVMMTSGEQFAVVPQGGSTNASSMPAGGSGGGSAPIYVNINISSAMTFMDEQRAQNTLLPMIINGIRQAKAQGAIK